MDATTKTTAGTKAKLSNGKIVVLSTYGWHQPEAQYDAHGFFTADETAEAWKLWDAAQKTTPPGAQPNNPVGERPDSAVGRRPPAGNGARKQRGATKAQLAHRAKLFAPASPSIHDDVAAIAASIAGALKSAGGAR